MAMLSPQIDTHGELQEFLSQTRGHYIDGQWVSGGDIHPINIVNPATGITIAAIESGGAVEIDLAVNAARTSFNSGVWAKTTPVERAQILFSLADLIEEHAEQIAHIEALDIGVSRAMMRDIGVKLAADQLRYYAGWVTKIGGQTISNSRTPAPGREFLTYTVKEPIGVVGQIIPWNFPFGMSIGKIAPALAAGCSLVLKPAEEAPLSVSYLAELISKTDLPDGVFNLVNGVGRKAGSALARHQDVDKISFTGSTAVGKDILSAAGSNLKKVTLELGGKSPVVILKDADLSEAIPAAARAIFFLNGQNCMAGSRLLVHTDIHDEVVKGLTEIAEAMSIGSDLDNAYDIGPLISKRQMTRVLAYIDTGLGEGATLATGGKRVSGLAGYFVQPTIFTNCTPNMRIVREEIFGPVLTIQKFDTDDLEKIAGMANDTVFGLSASVWTGDLSKGHILAGKIKAGQVGINVHAAIDPATPFGGYKQSGWGREFGRDGLEPYLETKAVTAYL